MNHGFQVYIIEDAIRGVEVNPGDTAKALEEPKAAGVIFITSDQVRPPVRGLP